MYCIIRHHQPMVGGISFVILIVGVHFKKFVICVVWKMHNELNFELFTLNTNKYRMSQCDCSMYSYIKK